MVTIWPRAHLKLQLPRLPLDLSAVGGCWLPEQSPSPPPRPFGSHAVAHSHLFMLAGPARSPWPRAPLARAARPTTCHLRNRVQVYEQGLRASRCYVWNIRGPHGRRIGAGLKHARPVDIEEAGLAHDIEAMGPDFEYKTEVMSSSRVHDISFSITTHTHK